MYNVFWYNIKGTVSVYSRESRFKDDNIRFTKIPLKALYNQVWIRYINVHNLKKRLFLTVVLIRKCSLQVFIAVKHIGMIRIKHF